MADPVFTEAQLDAATGSLERAMGWRLADWVNYRSIAREMLDQAAAAAPIDTPDVSPTPPVPHRPSRGDDVEVWLGILIDGPDVLYSEVVRDVVTTMRDFYLDHADQGLPLITDAERERANPVVCCTPDPFEPPCSPDCPRYLPPDPPERPRPPVPDLMAALEESLEAVKRSYPKPDVDG